MTGFHINEDSNSLRTITFEGDLVCSLDKNYCLCNLCLIPGETPRLYLQQIVWTAFHDQTTFSDFAFVSLSGSEAELTVRYECLSRHIAGKTTVKFSIDLMTHHITLTIDQEMTFEQATSCQHPIAPGSLSHFFRTQDTSYHDTGAYVMEFSDPWPYKIAGPATPITKDYPQVTSPVNCFSPEWDSPQYQSFVYQHLSGENRMVPCNHVVGHQKDFWELSEKGFVGCLDHPDKAFVWQLISSDLPVANHLCMWGFDLHFWLVLNSVIKDVQNPMLEAGTTFRVVYELRIPEASWCREISQKVKKVPEFTRDRYMREEVPVYVEGLNRFEEGLELADVRPFWHRDSLLYWDRSEGHSDRNALSIYHTQDKLNQWSLRLGQSSFGDPIDLGEDYQVSAYIKADTETGGAKVGLRFLEIENPGIDEKHHWTPWAWSPVIGGKQSWTLVEANSRSPQGLVIAAEIVFEFEGKGQVWMDDMVFTKQPSQTVS